jgi:hypothetical protein
MSTLYLFDRYTTPIADSRLVDVRSCEIDEEVNISSRFAVKAESSLQLSNPTDLNTLLTDKYAAMLAMYPGFTNIVYDALLDATGIDSSASSAPAVVSLGERGTISFFNGYIETTTTAIGSAPSQVVVLWEIHRITNDNPKTGVYDRFYMEKDAGDLTQMDISFDGGSNYTTVLPGVLASIAPGVQGTQLRLRITNTGYPKYLGSWAVIY